MDEDVLGSGAGIEMTWRAVPLATGYTVHFRADDSSSVFFMGADFQVNAASYSFDRELPPGKYTWRVDAYQDERMIAQSDSYQFTIVDSDGHLPGQTEVIPTSVPLPDQSGAALMALIPAGPFQMGDNASDQTPVHTVTLDVYKIDVYEVTNARYAECVADGYCRPQFIGNIIFDTRFYADHPANQVTWYDAKAYCAWRGARLPTEAEWEKAARGGLEGKKYPWGDEKPACTPGAPNGAQIFECSGYNPAAVGSFAPNGYGLFDMFGNVAEWVSDWFQENYYSLSPGSNPLGPDTGTLRVLRGGGGFSLRPFSNSSSVASRSQALPADASIGTGFRCATAP